MNSAHMRMRSQEFFQILYICFSKKHIEISDSEQKWEVQIFTNIIENTLHDDPYAPFQLF